MRNRLPTYRIYDVLAIRNNHDVFLKRIYSHFAVSTMFSKSNRFESNFITQGIDSSLLLQAIFKQIKQ